MVSPAFMLFFTMNSTRSLQHRSTQNAFRESSHLFRKELLPDERILWTGKPIPRIIFHRSDLVSIPFGVVLAVLSVLWEYTALSGLHAAHWIDAAWLTQAICAIPFLVLSQYVLWGRFFHTAQKKTHTFYAVTNRRVLVVRTGPRRRVTDGYIVGLDTISLVPGANGAGTIEFATTNGIETSWTGFERRQTTRQMDVDLESLAFYDIPNARSVYQLVQQTREQAHIS